MSTDVCGMFIDNCASLAQGNDSLDGMNAVKNRNGSVLAGEVKKACDLVRNKPFTLMCLKLKSYCEPLLNENGRHKVDLSEDITLLVNNTHIAPACKMMLQECNETLVPVYPVVDRSCYQLQLAADCLGKEPVMSKYPPVQAPTIFKFRGYFGLNPTDPRDNYFYVESFGADLTFQNFLNAFGYGNIKLPPPLGESGFFGTLLVSFSAKVGGKQYFNLSIFM